MIIINKYTTHYSKKYAQKPFLPKTAINQPICELLVSKKHPILQLLFLHN